MDMMSEGRISLFQFAPPRGGDARDPRKIPIVLISIRAPARGRRGSTAPSPAPSDFNSRPREGATGGNEQGQATAPISIRAPARGRQGN